MSTLQSQTVAISIDRPWEEVYAFASDPANLPHWAAGLGKGFERSGDDWIFHTPGGDAARMKFTASNSFGILDHDVYPQGQEPVHMAARVTPNGSGADVAFVVLRLPGMTAAEFERDTAAVRKDLETLKSILER